VDLTDRWSWWRRFGVAAVVLILVAAVGCESDDDEGDSIEEPTATFVAVATEVTSATATGVATSTVGIASLQVGIPPDSDWNWQLTGELDMSVDVDVWDVDLFEVEASKIAELHQAGRYVICYFSAGSIEDWRPDVGGFDESAIGKPLDGWPGEKWVDVRSKSAVALVEARIALAAEKGCDAVEPDNVNGYNNDSGFPLDEADQIQFNSKIAELGHARGVAVGLKNSFDIVDQLAGVFDFAVTEQCHEYDECELLKPFVGQGKPVFNAEYPGESSAGEHVAWECAAANHIGIRTVYMPLDLDGSWRASCS